MILPSDVLLQLINNALFWSTDAYMIVTSSGNHCSIMYTTGLMPCCCTINCIIRTRSAIHLLINKQRSTWAAFHYLKNTISTHLIQVEIHVIQYSWFTNLLKHHRWLRVIQARFLMMFSQHVFVLPTNKKIKNYTTLIWVLISESVNKNIHFWNTYFVNIF